MFLKFWEIEVKLLRMSLDQLKKYENELARANKMRIVASEETGEVKEIDASFYYSKDPSYVKWYTDCLDDVPALQNGLPGLFFALLPYIKYADADDDFGGMYVIIDKCLKMRIAAKLNISFSRVEHTIQEMTKSHILKRVCTGRYQVNACILGKGAWLDIKQVKNQFKDASETASESSVETEAVVND